MGIALNLVLTGDLIRWSRTVFDHNCRIQMPILTTFHKMFMGFHPEKVKGRY